MAAGQIPLHQQAEARSEGLVRVSFQVSKGSVELNRNSVAAIARGLGHKRESQYKGKDFEKFHGNSVNHRFGGVRINGELPPLCLSLELQYPIRFVTAII
jgi:hypothetical protein